MGEADAEKNPAEVDALSQLNQAEREVRKLRREIIHLKNAITQEKLASTTLLNQQKASTFIQRERERYLALLLANSPSIILFLNQSSRVEFCTEYFVTKAGFEDMSAVLGRTLPEVLARFLDSAAHEKLLAQCRSVIESKAPLSIDLTFHFAPKAPRQSEADEDEFGEDDSAEDFAGLLVPMIDEAQHTNGLMLMFHDVTVLKRSREEALAASKAKSAFLSNMSHEIRTPMNAIIGMTAIGKQEKSLKRKDYAFEKIENASSHLLGVINDILDISKIESGKMELSCVNFDFSHMLDRVISVISLKMQEKHQHFAVEVDPLIPQTLYGDDQRLAQVITNLLSNANKFTPENGRIVFQAQLQSQSDQACVISMSIKDSGIGMSKQEQSRLFNIFQQAEAGTARKYGGSGLGLAISKRILELMGGDIGVESEPGVGSCFFFTASLGLPHGLETAAVGSLSHDTAEDRSQGSDFSGKVLLIVDDIDINLEIISALLEPTNITVVTAQNGREAVETFTATPDRFDLILMDVQMPEIDGLQATQMIRALPTPKAATIPIVAMTANVFKEDIEKCLAAGMNDHLGKPVVIQDVINILAHYFKPDSERSPA